MVDIKKTRIEPRFPYNFAIDRLFFFFLNKILCHYTSEYSFIPSSGGRKFIITVTTQSFLLLNFVTSIRSPEFKQYNIITTRYYYYKL